MARGEGSSAGKKQNHTYCSIYDAHAGKIGKPKYEIASTDKSILDPLAPEEYLLKRHVRLLTYPYEERTELPDSDLVTAIHFYISQQCQRRGRQDLLQIYDGTALIAIAIELEEKIKENLGPNGHLVYAQPRDADAGEESSQEDISADEAD